MPLEIFFYFDSWTVKIETALRDYLIPAILFTRREMRHRKAVSFAQCHTAQHVVICAVDTKLHV